MCAGRNLCAPSQSSSRDPDSPFVHLRRLGHAVGVGTVVLAVRARAPGGVVEAGVQDAPTRLRPALSGSHWARRRGTSPVLAHGEGRTPVTWMLSMNQ